MDERIWRQTEGVFTYLRENQKHEHLQDSYLINDESSLIILTDFIIYSYSFNSKYS